LPAFDFNLSRLTIAIKKSANAAKVKIANTRSNIDDSIVTPNTSSFEIITFTEKIPKAIDTKRRRFVFRFLYFWMFSGIKNSGFISITIVAKVNITMNNLST
jgi:hypothetical protein